MFSFQNVFFECQSWKKLKPLWLSKSDNIINSIIGNWNYWKSASSTDFIDAPVSGGRRGDKKMYFKTKI